MKTIRRILVPTDFSECSGAAADFAHRLAQEVEAAIELVTVVDTSPLRDAHGNEARRNQRISAIQDAAREKLWQFSRQHFAGLGAIQLQVRHGNTLAEILEAAHRSGSDLIVMGTQGRTGLAHLLIGSIAEKVVRHSEIPVITVRPPQPE